MFGVDIPVYGSNPPKNKGNLGPAIPTDMGYHGLWTLGTETQHLQTDV